MPSGGRQIIRASSSTSIGALFLGDIVPGLMLTGAMMLTVALMATRLNLQRADSLSARQGLRPLAEAVLPVTLTMTMMLLGIDPVH